jgi:hypothetical protein
MVGDPETAKSLLISATIFSHFVWRSALLLFSLLCVLIVSAGYSLCRIATRPPRGHGSHLLWRAASLIGLVRIGALWFGAAAYHSSGWAQSPGYVLLMLALPEIYLVKGVRAHLLIWGTVGSVLLAATSFLWAALLVWVADRISVRDSG